MTDQTLRRHRPVFLLLVLLLLLACQLPSRLVGSVRQRGEELTPTLSPTQSLPVQPQEPAGGITALPGEYPAAGTALPLPGTYPDPGMPQLTLQVEYPQQVTTEQPYPDQPTLAYPGMLDPSGYPGPNQPLDALAASATAMSQSGGQPYPAQGALTETPVGSPYPGQVTATATPAGSPYPGPATATGTLTRTPAGTPAGTPAASQASPTGSSLPSVTGTRLTGTPIRSGTQSGAQAATPSMTPTLTPAIQVTSTPTFIVASPSPSPTRTPFLTPTPTMTFTPTPTRTPLPAPPWMSVKIQASDPSTVKLAAGKPQLVEFFAYWSGPSLAMAPIVKGIESEYRGKVGFVYLDIDNPATRVLRAQLHFHIAPHFFLLDERGKILKEWVGYISYEKLRQAIDGAIE